MARENGTGTSDYTAERLEEYAARRVSLDRSAVRSINADEVEMSKSAVAVARFEHGTIRQGSAGIVIGRSVAMDEVKTGILISPVVRGDVHTLLDMRSAVAIGVGIVLGRTLLAGGRALVRRVLG
ncbi:MAG: hypothetical protein AB7J35_14940 [Dehalococcoidia bacterium]